MKHLVFFLFAFAIIWFFDRAAFRVRTFSVDSAVYTYIGRAMREGLVPYRDLFDHKGPLLYFINSLNVYLQCVVQIIALYVTLMFCDKSACLLSKAWQAFVGTLIAGMCLVTVMLEGANYPEFYSLPFIAVANYYFLKFICDKKLTFVQGLIIGLCFGGVLALKANLIGLWIVFGISILIKEPKKIISLALGAIIAILPFVVYLMAKGALADCWQSYIVFNSKFANTKLFSVGYCLRESAKLMPILPIATILLIWKICKKEASRALALQFAAFILTWILVIMAGRVDYNYFYALAPISAVLIAQVLAEKWLCVLVICPIIMGSNTARQHYNGVFGMDRDYLREEIAEVIHDNTSSGDKISVFGNDCNFYLSSGLESVSKYIYQQPIGDIDESLGNEYIKDIRQNRPQLVIKHCFDYEQLEKKVQEILSARYKLIYENGSVTIWALQNLI